MQGAIIREKGKKRRKEEKREDNQLSVNYLFGLQKEGKRYIETSFEVSNDLAGEISFLFGKEKSNRVERENRWKEFFLCYSGRPSLPEPNLDWQSRFVSSKFFYIVEQFAALIRRSLIQAGNFFSLHSNPEGELNEVAKALENLVGYYLTPYKFIEEFERALKFGAITGQIIIEIDWLFDILEVVGRKLPKGYPKITALNPLDTILDPSGLDRFYIKRTYVPIETAVRNIRLGIWKEVEIQSTIPPKYEDDPLYSKIYYDFSQQENLVEVLDFYGTLHSQEKIYQDIHIVVLNRQDVVKAETMNFWHNSLPIIYTQLYKPFIEPYGFGLLDNIESTVKNFNLLARNIIDNVLLSTGIVLEIDQNRITGETKKKLKNEGVTPFMFVLKDGPEKVVDTTSYGQFNPNVLPLLQFFNQETQNTTGLTEPLTGMPTSKGRPTAREIMIKAQQSGEILDSIVIKIENLVLEQIIYKLLLLILQYESPVKVASILGDKFEILRPYFENEENKINLAIMLAEKIGIKVDGITQTLHRQEIIEKILNFLQIVSSLPQVNINYNYFLDKLMTLFGFFAKDVKNEEQQRLEAQLRQQSIEDLKTTIRTAIVSENMRNIIVELLEQKISPEAIGAVIRELPENVINSISKEEIVDKLREKQQQIEYS